MAEVPGMLLYKGVHKYKLASRLACKPDGTKVVHMQAHNRLYLRHMKVDALTLYCFLHFFGPAINRLTVG